MSTLKRALERSKAAWEAVGKPERARAVLRSASGDTYAGDGSILIHVDRAASGKWRAIVPKVKYEPVGTLPVVGDWVMFDVKSKVFPCFKAKVAEVTQSGLVRINHENPAKRDWPFDSFTGDRHYRQCRVLKRKVPKKAEDAGWPRYYVRDSNALVLHTASRKDGTYYGEVETRPVASSWWSPGVPESDGFKPVTAHQFAEWLYDHGHTEAAYKIEVMWESEGTIARVGDWWAHVVPPQRVTDDHAANGALSNHILRRSRARRDAIAEIEARLKALGDVK